MRLKYSEKVEKLYKMVEPFIVITGVHASIDENAPDEIQKAYKEWKRLAKEEYMEAMCL